MAQIENLKTYFSIACVPLVQFGSDVFSHVNLSASLRFKNESLLWLKIKLEFDMVCIGLTQSHLTTSVPSRFIPSIAHPPSISEANLARNYVILLQVLSILASYQNHYPGLIINHIPLLPP